MTLSAVADEIGGEDIAGCDIPEDQMTPDQPPAGDVLVGEGAAGQDGAAM